MKLGGTVLKLEDTNIEWLPSIKWSRGMHLPIYKQLSPQLSIRLVKETFETTKILLYWEPELTIMITHLFRKQLENGIYFQMKLETVPL